MIMKLTTNQKAEVWVNLDQIVQMTTMSVQDGYPSTEIIMANGAAINVYEKPVDIANWTKAVSPCSTGSSAAITPPRASHPECG
jgi:hypothetical protein